MDIFESLENLNVSEECFDEIMGIVEELLNEKATVGQLAMAASNRMEREKIKNEEANKNLKDEASKANPSNEKLRQYTQDAIDSARRYRHGKRLDDLNLPKESKVSANSLFRAADKVQTSRFEKSQDNPIRGEQDKTAFRDKKRLKRAIQLTNADPVVNRKERKGLTIVEK